MRVMVVGAGAVGSFVGGTLAAAGADVVLVSRSAAPTASAPLTLVDPDGTERTVAIARAAAGRLDDCPTPDAVVLSVKQPDLASAIAAIARWPDAPVVTAQNGIGAEDAVLAARPVAPLVAASLTAAVELAGRERVVRRRRGGIGLAAWTDVPAATGLARELVRSFEHGSLPARAYPDAAAMKWSKLAANLVANATSALLDADPSAIYADPRLFVLERRQLREAFAVMRRLGLSPVRLPGANVPLLAFGLRLPAVVARPILRRVVGGARGGKAPSLRMGVGASGDGATEARWLNGAVAAAGAALGVPTPVNDALARLVGEASADPRRRAELVGRPDRLLALVGG